MKLDPLYRWERRIAALPMPSPIVWAAMIAAFLGFGVLMGRVTRGASARSQVVMVAATRPAGSAPAPQAIPPASQKESTPEASSKSEPSKSSNKEPSSGSSSPPASTSSGGSEGQSSSQSGESSSQGNEGSSSKSPAKLPAIEHVFVVMLSEQPYATAFGPASEAHYLTGTLAKQGTTLERYYGVAQQSLAATIALLSGQGPTEATASNCPTPTPLAATGAGPDGQVLGQGCVYPSSTETLPAQLSAKHLSWKAYVEGLDEGASTPPACASPSAGVARGPGYEPWRNPFVYFAGLAASATCRSDDVGMPKLKGDLASEAKTASFSYLAPGPCQDGAPTPCAPGRPAGMAAADGFLKKIVPQILAAPAYKKNGLLVITVDAAPTTGEWADSSSCCGQPKFPNLPPPTGAAKLSPPGGGQVGALLLSPFIKKGGALVQTTYNHFSLLATIERLFGLPKLGYAALSEAKPLSASLFSTG